MSERTAKRLRKENAGKPEAPKQYFKPFTLPLPTGEILNNERVMEDTYIPRTQKRKAMRAMLTDIRKGRLNGRQQQRKGL